MNLKLAEEQHQVSRVLFRAALVASLLLPLSAYADRSSDPPPGAELVARALATELKAVQDAAHPMQYRLRKSSPRLTSTKQIVETKDGAVARLLSVNDSPLNAVDRQKDDARLDALLADPSKQHKRKQSESEDTARALKVLRVLPKAFNFQYAGPAADGSSGIERFTFTPNPAFNPSDLELTILTAMTGTLTVDSAHQRVVRLEGHLQQDVDIGWGILGRLNKGGRIEMEQADVGAGQWRIVHFQMVMNGRVFFKTRTFDTTEDESEYAPVPAEMTYQQAIQMLRSQPNGADPRGR